MLGLDINYLCTKFDHYSFSHSRDMVGAHQNLNGSCDLMPLSGMICHPWAIACHDQSTYEDMKGDTKYRKWGGLGQLGVTQGH